MYQLLCFSFLALSLLPPPVQSWSLTTRSNRSLRTTELFVMAESQEKPKHVVIAGAGVIGLSTSYYLAKNFNMRTTVVDPTG